MFIRLYKKSKHRQLMHQMQIKPSEEWWFYPQFNVNNSLINFPRPLQALIFFQVTRVLKQHTHTLLRNPRCKHQRRNKKTRRETNQIYMNIQPHHAHL